MGNQVIGDKEEGKGNSDFVIRYKKWEMSYEIWGKKEKEEEGEKHETRINNVKRNS